MSMMVTGSLYNSYAAQDSANNVKKKETDAKTAGARKQGSEVKQPQLSAAAQKLLEKLKRSYGNMDFMVYSDRKDAKELLSHGTKEFSVLFSSDELEKMASDEKYEKEYMDRVQGAVRMSDEINRKYGFTSAFGERTDDAQIKRIGVAFDTDGEMTIFAELEKVSAGQRERIEKGREKRAEEKKASERRGVSRRNEPVKRTIVEASSEKELIKKINEIDWSKVQEERKQSGSRFDYSI